jgi:crotonobetainyl-CoA:carnitine CoA-transferase CaiB-like acyl-CoA transferase
MAMLLSGIKVVEFGQIVAGPFAGLLLADLGADVVKVEDPDGGDRMRLWPPILRGRDNREYGANFAALNRNKRSVALDLKNPEQNKIAIDLCLTADVVIENFRPGTLARYGLGHQALRASRPRLIYCSISGYGQDGPLARRSAFDVTVQGASGLMSVTGEKNGSPVKCGVPVADLVAALYAVSTICAALEARRRTGEGCRIDCSMFASLLGISALQTSGFFATNKPPGRLGTAHAHNAPYQAFRAKDKSFIVAAGTEKLWRNLCEVLGVKELVFDPRFDTQEKRVLHQEALAEILQERFATQTAQHWLEALDRYGIPCAPINDYGEALAEQQVATLGLVGELNLPNGLAIHTVKFPVLVDGAPGTVFRDPPDIGANTREVVSEWLGQRAGGP